MYYTLRIFCRYFTSKGSLKSISKKVKDKDLLGGDLDDEQSNCILIYWWHHCIIFSGAGHRIGLCKVMC